jgi:hypothetical protein
MQVPLQCIPVPRLPAAPRRTRGTTRPERLGDVQCLASMHRHSNHTQRATNSRSVHSSFKPRERATGEDTTILADTYVQLNLGPAAEFKR